MDFAKKLEESESFAEIFDLVKKSVQESLDRRREGLMIALQYLPENLGAYYGLGSNFIVMNKALLEKFNAAYDEKDTNAYVFSILMHEYLHSLGYVDEEYARALTYQVCKAVLGEGHLATKIARDGIGAFINPSPRGMKGQENEGIEVVDSFTIEHITYIG
ncbi:MAG TPA: hypothetical protein VJ485_01455 [archaeon]|nr:hypothetical protein [archaeon]